MPNSETSNQLKTFFKNLSTARKVTLFLLICGVTAGFSFLMIWANKPDFQVLYSGLATEDAGTIIQKLKENKIPYQISSNGKSIMVPKEHVYETRLGLASQGLPQGGAVGFEIFDNTQLGTTDFVMNINYQRACQGELSRTINGLAEVESSRVHIVMPTSSLFVEDEKPATASVVLKMKRGKSLNKAQIQGIVHLIASSVSGLKPDNITVLDNSGNMLSGFLNKSSDTQFSSEQLELQNKIEKDLGNRVKTMLEKALGPGKAAVRIACSLDFKRHEKTEEIYQPGNRAIRSEQLNDEISRTKQEKPVGIPGVVSNMSETKAPETLSNKEPVYQKKDRTVNYEVGKVISHIVEPVGNIRRMSVAVIIDGTYSIIKNEDGEEERKYIPRTPDEMNKFEQIIKSSVNFDEKRGDRIEVVNIPFESSKLNAAESEGGIIEDNWLSKVSTYKPFIKYGFLFIFILSSFIFIVRPLMRWIASGGTGEVKMLNQLPMTVEEIERAYGEEQKTMPYNNQALEMIAGNKEKSVELMKDWIKES